MSRPPFTRRLALALVPAAGALPAACAQGGEGAPAAGSSPVELRLHGSSNGAEGDYWPKVAADFNARQTKIHATFEPWAPDKNAIVMGAAGTLGDVMRLVAAGEYAQVAAKGLLKALDPLIARERYDLKQFYAAAVETLKFRAKQFGLPHIAHPGFCGQFVNLDALKQAGLREPDESAWTLSDFQNLARQLSTARTGEGSRWGLWPPTGIQHITVAARAFGGDTMTADGKRCLVAEPASLQGLQYLADLILKDRSAPPPGTLQGSDAQNFVGGQVAIVWTNFGIINTLKKQAQGLQWQTFLSPKGPQARGFFMGVDAAAMNVDSKHPDQAFELVKYVVSKEVSLGWFDVGFAPGGRPDTWTDPKVVSDPAFKVFARAMGEAQPLHFPDNGLITDFNNAITKELAALWSSQAGVKDAAEAARRGAQEVLDRNSA